MSGRLWLCFWICFFCSLLQLSAPHRQLSSSVGPGAWNQDKPKRLFARTRYLSTQRLQTLRPKAEPLRRCAGLTESCSGHIPCCEPCASCHCRLFNTICHCWRLGSCPRKT